MKSRVTELVHPDLTFRSDVPAERLTTFGFGGLVRTLCDVRSLDGLQLLLKHLAQTGDRYRVIGRGSNLLIRDEGIAEPVIRLGGNFANIEEVRNDVDAAALALTARFGSLKPGRFLCGAAAPVMPASRKFSEAGWTGLEFAAGIPASFGGAVRMNSGAHHGAFEQIIVGIAAVSEAGNLQILSKEELQFSYRHTALEATSIVSSVLIELQAGERDAIVERRNSCLEYRKRTQPLHMPSAGSIFRNPHQQTVTTGDGSAPSIAAAAQLLERAQIKGMRKGGVEFSTMHSNWLVKCGDDAKAEDALWLIDAAKKRVAEAFGVELVPELIVWP